MVTGQLQSQIRYLTSGSSAGAVATGASSTGSLPTSAMKPFCTASPLVFRHCGHLGLANELWNPDLSAQIAELIKNILDPDTR